MNRTSESVTQQQTQDQILYCENCGISFLWAREEHQLEQHGSQETPATSSADAADDALHATPQANRTPTFCPGCRVILPPSGFERGLVKWFNRRRRYGFIIRKRADEIFVHGSDIVGRQSVRPGDLVEFRVEEGQRGLMAKELRIVDHTTEPIVE